MLRKRSVQQRLFEPIAWAALSPNLDVYAVPPKGFLGPHQAIALVIVVTDQTSAPHRLVFPAQSPVLVLGQVMKRKKMNSHRFQFRCKGSGGRKVLFGRVVTRNQEDPNRHYTDLI